MDYPKVLYSPKGWDAINDCRVVTTPADEEAARSEGYGDLEPPKKTAKQSAKVS